eukprot:TRINITY_DN164121_c0_g2_i1.p1 TRINITY_DN164121_c0_g2~~TRINITY_DN164121_c0_g2_i1.p1  ORF type:complete len:418 (+),score=58.31 TRINITY_DN164121_c0_g2_i1:43-1254(+)
MITNGGLKGLFRSFGEFVPKFALKGAKVVLAIKTSQYDFQKQIYGAATDDTLEKSGIDVNRLKQSHTTNKTSIDATIRALQALGANVRVLTDLEIMPFHTQDADLVVSAGGDGSFLRAASSIHSPNIPILGINNNPLLSQGELCGFEVPSGPIEDKYNSLMELFQKLNDDEFHVVQRRRIETTLERPGGAVETLPKLALNEVFVAESNPSRASKFDLLIENPRPLHCGIDLNLDPAQEARASCNDPECNSPMQSCVSTSRCSGIMVCTGSGSSAWWYSLNQLFTDDISVLLDTFGQHVEKDKVQELTDRMNQHHIFSTDLELMGYALREPIFNAVYAPVRRKGFCSAITLSTMGLSTEIFLDGISSHSLPKHTQVHLTLPEHAMLTAISPGCELPSPPQRGVL